ncbi:MAG: GSCFA domain-containing protein [Candidatus Eremiobacteraeota bacterium]|nr:GSCFA domain-containing protein [Candidatus Eremiobacteraeota bacterium]
MTQIDGEVARRNLLASKASRWTAAVTDPAYGESAHGRLAAGIALPRVTPKFQLNEDDVFFCIGSCFVRNIEEHLIYRGIAVESKSIAFEKRTGRPNAYVNKFTTGSILNELRWSLAGDPFPDGSLVETDDGWRDMQLAPSAVALPLDEARARRAMVTEYFGRIRNATVVVITLGLTETWYDAQAGVMLNAAPSLAQTRRFPGRFRLHVTDHAENLAALRAIYDLLGAHAAPSLRIVVTVSPVPMRETFTGQDILVANTYSKSVLRVAADDSARDRANVQYYPSYEAVTVSNRALTYSSADDLHVRDAAVDAVTGDFLRTYGITRERPHPEFVELHYLFANPDVHDAVLAQRFPSGYAHWLAYGRAEGRPLRAAEPPPSLDELIGL